MWEGLGRAANVMQVAGMDARQLVVDTANVTRTARQNNDDCELLNNRVQTLRRRFPGLEQDAALEGLHAALLEADDLISSCRRRGWVTSVSKVITANRVADRFRDVEKKIDFCLLLIRGNNMVIPTRVDGTDHLDDADRESVSTSPSRQSPDEDVQTKDEEEAGEEEVGVSDPVS